MNVVKAAILGMCCTLTGVYAEAALVRANFVGNQTGYSITMPSLPTLSAEMDQDHPFLSGFLVIDLANPASSLATGEIIQPYFNVEYFNGGSSAPVATTSFPYSLHRMTFNSGSWSYDPGNLTLSGSALMRTTGATPFCVGLLAVCAGVYGQEAGVINLDVILTFADASRGAFSGVGTYSRTLASGAIITAEYTFNSTTIGEVPLPAAAWLFGSGLIGLAGAARRNRRRLAAAG